MPKRKKGSGFTTYSKNGGVATWEKVAAKKNRHGLTVRRAADGWLIEEDKAGYKRRSADRFKTYQAATKAIEQGYQLPVVKHVLPSQPVILKVEAYARPGGKTCYWCALDGQKVTSAFSVKVGLGGEKYTTTGCCDPIRHGLHLFTKLNPQFRPLEEA